MPSFVEKFHYSGQLLQEKPLNCGYPSGKLHTKREGPRFARALIMLHRHQTPQIKALSLSFANPALFWPFCDFKWPKSHLKG